jgi:hypothetical protein
VISLAPATPDSVARPRYRLGVAGKTRADVSDAVSQLADSGGKAVINLAFLPLRMLIGALDFVETQVHKAADGLRNIDPLDERLIDLERRLDSLEHQGTGRRQSSAARQRASAGVSAEPERADQTAGRGQTSTERGPA